MTRIVRLGLIGFCAVWTPLAAVLVSQGVSSADWSGVLLPGAVAGLAAAFLGRGRAARAGLRAIAEHHSETLAGRARA